MRLHPHFRRVRHEPHVRGAVAAVRTAWATHDGTHVGGETVLAAEWGLNDAVEIASCGLGPDHHLAPTPVPADLVALVAQTRARAEAA